MSRMNRLNKLNNNNSLNKELLATFKNFEISIVFFETEILPDLTNCNNP